MKALMGGLVAIGGLIAAAYVGIFVVFFGGIANIVDGVKANPTDASQIGWGIIEVCFLAELAAAAIILVSFLVAAAIGYSNPVSKRLRRRRQQQAVIGKRRR